MSDVLARAAEVLGAHYECTWNGRPGGQAAMTCGAPLPPMLRVRIGAAHLAQMLADAGLLAESAPVARGNGARSAQDGEPR